MGAPHANVAAALAAIVRSEGVAALFNGVLLSLVKQGPQMAITMSTYEVLAHACVCVSFWCLCQPAASRSSPEGGGSGLLRRGGGMLPPQRPRPLRSSD